VIVDMPINEVAWTGGPDGMPMPSVALKLRKKG
jgi:hypothetical protein